jgi:hypothetical protein
LHTCLVLALPALMHSPHRRTSGQQDAAPDSMNLKALRQALGPWDAGLYLLSRVVDKLSGGRARLVKYHFVAQPIGSPSRQPMRPDTATEIRRVEATDPLRQAFPRPAAILDRRYAAGGTCTAALLRGEFAGFIWIQRACYDEDEVRCRYVLQAPQASVWDYDVYVEPRFRAGRTMARLWTHVDQELAATGVRWSFSRISAFNAASLASHARLGAVRCGSAVFFCWGRLQLAIMPSRPCVHLSSNDRTVPELRLLIPD